MIIIIAAGQFNQGWKFKASRPRDFGHNWKESAQINDLNRQLRDDHSSLAVPLASLKHSLKSPDPVHLSLVHLLELLIHLRSRFLGLKQEQSGHHLDLTERGLPHQLATGILILQQRTLQNSFHLLKSFLLPLLLQEAALRREVRPLPALHPKIYYSLTSHIQQLAHNHSTGTRTVSRIFYCFVNKIKMKQLRQTMIADAELMASKRRFGLFSQPPPIGLGDDSQYQPKKINKGQDGKPKTSPRNILPGQNRTGVGKKAFLQTPQSIYQKDPYKDQLSVEMQYHNKMHTKSPMHETDFVPASGFKTITNSPFPHMEEKEYAQKKAKRDESGKVKTEPSNIITNPTSKVETKLFKPLPHMRDEYSRRQQVERQEKELWKSKIIHEVMFKSMSHGDSNFTKDKVAYGIDDKTKLIMSQKKSQGSGNNNGVAHETNFKLARKGHGDPIGRYPEYVKPRERAHTEATQASRLKTDKSDNQKQLWKPSSGNLSRPTPSVSLMAKNIRRCM